MGMIDGHGPVCERNLPFQEMSFRFSVGDWMGPPHLWVFNFPLLVNRIVISPAIRCAPTTSPCVSTSTMAPVTPSDVSMKFSQLGRRFYPHAPCYQGEVWYSLDMKPVSPVNIVYLVRHCCGKWLNIFLRWIADRRGVKG